MIKAKVVSFTLSESVDSISKLDLETYLEDQVDLSSFCVGMDFDGLNAVIMTEEEYEDEMSKNASLRKRLNEKEGEIVNNDIEQTRFRERLKQLNEEVEKLKRENTELTAKNADIRFDRGIVKEQSETIQKLEEENISIRKVIKDLEEQLAQDTDQIDIHPDGTFVFKKKRVLELEKEVEKLKEENKDLKEKLLTRYTISYDADGAIIYPESKED